MESATEKLDNRSSLDKLDHTPIQDFYKDAKVFITGSTGFLGQVLVEKLLRCCSVSTLYLLIRYNQGKDPNTRLDQMFADQFFSKMKAARPDYRQRVIVVEGDFACPDLGLSLQDKRLLMDEANVVFHMAGTARLDETLKTATNLNVRATRDLSRFVQQMTQLKSFVHMSTAYSNCTQQVIEERIYPPPMTYKHLLEVNDFCDDFLLNYLTPRLLENYPNTYVYTKQVAEQVVEEETKALPSGIYRPAIAISTCKEPVKGWMNNIYGTSGFLFGAGLGPLRIHLCDPSIHANIIPTDMCVNGLVACAWDVAERFKSSKDANAEFQIPVYSYESTTDQPITIRDFFRISSGRTIALTSTKSTWSFGTFYTKSYKVYKILTYVLHYMPSMVADAILVCKGKKMRLVKTYEKIHDMSYLTAFLVTKPLTYKSTNVGAMLSHMSKTDRQIFHCDLKELDWNELFGTYLGSDTIETISQGNVRHRSLIWLHWCGLTVTFILMASILWFLMFTIYRTKFS